MNESAELVLDGRAPIAQQIEAQIRLLVRSGALSPGAELPTVREVAVGLSVNPHVVEHAYDRLERAGVVTRADGGSPRVVGPASSPPDADLKQWCQAFLRRAAERGHSFAEVLRAFQACLEEE
jgi:GntR family transcriptional regulator